MAFRTPTLNVGSAEARFHTWTPWPDSRHSFSFGKHHDPENTHHGLLLVSNDDIVGPRTEFMTHPQRRRCRCKMEEGFESIQGAVYLKRGVRPK